MSLRILPDYACQTCGAVFRPAYTAQKFCGRECSYKADRGASVYDRFWPKVEKRGDDECWPFTGGMTDRQGYGRFGFADRTMGYSHRVAWSLANQREIPLGMVVCHSCDNPSCCNPAHLWLGTVADNNRDMSVKGRNHQQRKTHCPQGHEYTPENTRMNAKGRLCRTCQNEGARRRYHKRRAVEALA